MTHINGRYHNSDDFPHVEFLNHKRNYYWQDKGCPAQSLEHKAEASGSR